MIHSSAAFLGCSSTFRPFPRGDSRLALIVADYSMPRATNRSVAHHTSHKFCCMQFHGVFRQGVRTHSECKPCSFRLPVRRYAARHKRLRRRQLQEETRCGIRCNWSPRKKGQGMPCRQTACQLVVLLHYNSTFPQQLWCFYDSGGD